MDTRGTLLDALACGAAAGATGRRRAAEQRGAEDAAITLAVLARGRPDNCAALVADARVVPALAAAICSRHADGAVVEAAMFATAIIVSYCPAEATGEPVDSLVRLGALDAAVQRLSAGGRFGGTSAFLIKALVQERHEGVAGAAVAAGALPQLLALLADADDTTAVEAAAALVAVIYPAGSPSAAAAVDAGAVRALVEQLGRAGGPSESLIVNALIILTLLAQTTTGADRLVADGALPHVVGLLRSPDQDVAPYAVNCLAAAMESRSGGVAAEALLANVMAGPALAALLQSPNGDTPFTTAATLGEALRWALASGSPEASRHAGGLAAAVCRAGAVPRLVELLRTTLEGGQRRALAVSLARAVALVCNVDAAAAREALGAGAWPEACRAVVHQDARTESADEQLVAQSLSLLANLAPHLRNAAPCPAAAAEPGLAAALGRALGRVAARALPGSGGRLLHVTKLAGDASAVLEAAVEGPDGAQRAAEFVDAGGAGHLVRHHRRGRWDLWEALGRARMWAHTLARVRLQVGTPLS
jgi:hypothetical protein